MSGQPTWAEDQAEALIKRGLKLENSVDLNGLRELQVLSIEPTVNGVGGSALACISFFNKYLVSDIRQKPEDYFYIEGGSRVQMFQIIPAAAQDIPANLADTMAYVRIKPLGDYSEYILRSRAPANQKPWDPLFQNIAFRFRPECYSSDCRLVSGRPPPEKQPAPMDYLARDYDGFRHMLFSYLSLKVPGWRPSSEADLDQVLVSLISGTADQLADFQDRVAVERNFFTARKRVSLARHARLVDYHIHQGRQSSGFLFVKVPADKSFYVQDPLTVGLKANASDDLVWSLRPEESFYVSGDLNELDIYDWAGTRTMLEKGSVEMDVTSAAGGLDLTAAQTLAEHLRTAQWLWIEETRNPVDGSEGGRNLLKRQRLQLLPGPHGAEALEDPVEGPNHAYVRLRWRPQDALKDDYFFRVRVSDQHLYKGAAVRGNLVQAYQGDFETEVFTKQGGQGTTAWVETARWGILCKLRKGPVLYKTLSDDGQKYPFSTIRVRVLVEDVAIGHWEERESFVLSDDSDHQGRHFVVETDETRITTVRFGDGVQGQTLPEGARVEITYQKGRGEEGNIGADRIQYIGSYRDPVDHSIQYAISVRNPWEIADGVAPEPVAQILRRVPEMYRLKQQRAVTLTDVVDRAEEHPLVDKAKAFYVWTGSWRSVRVLVDAKGPDGWNKDLENSLRDSLEPLMMIGEDLELRPPRYIPLLVTVTLCIAPPFSQAVIRAILQEEFSSGYTSDGRKGFFHPSLWTFGQALEESPLLGRVQAVEGVDHVESVSTIRWSELIQPVIGRVDVGPDDIIQVLSNPDGAEKGYIQFIIKGGRP